MTAPRPEPDKGPASVPPARLGSDVVVGVAAAHGVAVGPAVVLRTAGVSFPRRKVGEDELEHEWHRFKAAVHDVQEELRAVATRMPRVTSGAPSQPGEAGLRVPLADSQPSWLTSDVDGGRESLDDDGGAEASILDAYILMVGDEVLARAVRAEIEHRQRCAEWAVDAAIGRLAGELAAVEDAYLRERSHDVVFVGERILRALVGVAPLGRELAIDQPSVVVARDLSPADTAAMLHEPVLGFVTEIGSRTCHTAIMARALGIPAVVGAEGVLARVRNGDTVIVDGLRGTITARPSEADLEEARGRSARYRELTRELDKKRAEPATTEDGTTVALYANIELPAEAPVAWDHGAIGIGLYRTEFLYVNRADPPDEDEQFAVFRSVVDAMQGRPVTLRTFDIGGDKFVTSFRLPMELNPMLGLRAVRLALSRPELFMAHLRAMVRASAFGPVSIMVPMVSSLEELRAVRVHLNAAVEAVRAGGAKVAARIPLGVMIEVPSAALLADAFAREADFLSIGTNDLVQYTLAVDRSNRALAELASPFHPAVMRLVSSVIRAGRATGCPVSLCGEMASEPLGAVLLLGLGLRSFSMEAAALAEVKEAVRRVRLVEAEQVAARALDLSTASEVTALVHDTFAARMRDLLTGEIGAQPLGRRMRRSGRGGVTLGKAHVAPRPIRRDED